MRMRLAGALRTLGHRPHRQDAALLCSWALASVVWSGWLVATGPAAHLIGALLVCLGGAIWFGRDGAGVAKAAGLASAGLLLVAWGAPTAGAMAPLAAGVGLGAWSSISARVTGRATRAPVALTVAATWYWIAHLLIARTPWGWDVSELLSRGVCRIASLLTRVPADFGPEPLALQTAVTLTLPVLALAVGDGRVAAAGFARWLACCAAIVALGAVGQSLLVPGPPTTAAAIARSEWLRAATTALMATGAFVACVLLAEARSEEHTAARRPVVVILCVGALAAGAALSYAANPAPGSRTIAVYRDNAVDFSWSPAGGAGRSSGRFALLDAHLRSYGFRVETARPGRLSSTLPRADAIIFPQPTRRLSAPNLAALREFIRRGGGMVYIGDHTDVGGCRGPANEVLEPYGIRLRFDTALPAADGWPGALWFADHPATRGVTNVAYEASWWSGASLRISPGVMPIIIGRSGVSDLGRAENRRNACLGNYRVDRGERVGELVLAAAATSGRGRVAAFGDSSCWQNAAAADAWRLCYQTASWAADRPYRPAHAWPAVLLLLAAAALLGMLRSLPSTAVAALAVVAATLATSPPASPPAIAPEGSAVSCVWRPPLSGISGHPKGDSGLETCLSALSGPERVARVTTTLPIRFLLGTRLLVIPSLGPRVSCRDRETIDRWVRTGATLVLACGPEDSAHLRAWAMLDGADITAEPLGNGPALTKDGAAAQACDAFELRLSAAHWRPLLWRFGTPFAAERPYGAGRVLLLADPALLTNRGLQTPAAVQWLRETLGPRAPPPPSSRPRRSSAVPPPPHCLLTASSPPPHCRQAVLDTRWAGRYSSSLFGGWINEQIQYRCGHPDGLRPDRPG